jgi:hypothetical protein
MDAAPVLLPKHFTLICAVVDVLRAAVGPATVALAEAMQP